MECILNLVDPQFEITQGLQYRLSVLLYQDGFSFLVTDAGSKRILKLASYKLMHSGIPGSETSRWPVSSDAYCEQLKKTEFTQTAFSRIDIAIASHKITVAPYNFMTGGNIFDIMSAAHFVSDSEEILSESIFDLGPVAAIAFPGYVKEYCETIFPGSILHAAPAVFIKGVVRNHAHLIARQVFINVYSSFFEITVIQGSRLLYLNTFRYNAPSDVLYYVIFVLEQLGFVPSEENITMMGDISMNETIFTQLKMYCASINFAAQPEGIDFAETFDGIEMHKYFTLLNIPICE